jgi:gluconolactonase
MLNILQLDKFKKDVLIDTPFYTEGPVVDSQGNVFVTNLLGGQILKIDDQYIEEWATCKSPNGQFIAANGSHFICNSLAGSLECFALNGEVLKTWRIAEVDNHLVRCPNDLWVEPDHTIFFTDSVRHDGAVVCIDKEGQARVIVRNLDYPNGIVYDAKKKYLYVAESFKNRILMIDLQLDPPVVQVLVDLPKNPSGKETDNLPDGLTFDERGNLWIAHHGMGLVHCFDFQKNQLFSLESLIPLTSNIHVDNNRIIITGGLREPGPGRVRIIDR